MTQSRHLNSPLLAILMLLMAPLSVAASGHGPVFGLATPTNARGGWTLAIRY